MKWSFAFFRNLSAKILEIISVKSIFCNTFF